MKNLVLLSVVLVLVFGCKDDPEVLCDQLDIWEFVVQNDLSREIKITNDNPSGSRPNLFVIPTREKATVTEVSELGGCHDSPMREYLDGIEFRVVSVGALPGDGNLDAYYPFTMTVDGAKVPDDIWQNRYWVFEPGVFKSVYTLTVTDELLKSLSELTDTK